MKMKVQEFMSKNPVCCTPEMTIEDAARSMAANRCGALPVIDNQMNRKVIGMITDRDIVCRGVAEGMYPTTAEVRQCMSTPVATIGPEASVEQACALMAENQVRRLPVVDAAGHCEGIVAQADIARYAPPALVAETVGRVSRPTFDPSHVIAQAA